MHGEARIGKKKVTPNSWTLLNPSLKLQKLGDNMITDVHVMCKKVHETP